MHTTPLLFSTLSPRWGPFSLASNILQWGVIGSMDWGMDISSPMALLSTFKDVVQEPQPGESQTGKNCTT